MPGLTYYFRDFSLSYFPIRDAIVSTIRAGRWPWWNPYLHEGCAFPPMFYPLELAQVLWPGPAFVSWLLTLHFPIAALAAWLLARDLGAERGGAFVAGTGWATCGLAVSSLDLHPFLPAYALAPLVAATLHRAARGGGRNVALAAVALAVAVSTLAVEFVVQAVLLGLVLATIWSTSPFRQRAARTFAATTLGLSLAGLPISLVLGLTRESVRGAGLGTTAALEKSLHPLSLLQLVIPDLHGSIAEPLRAWWGGRLLEGPPYFLSLYLGPIVLALAIAGVPALARKRSAAMICGGLLGLLIALGPWGGLAAALARVAPWFRFPVKAMLLPTLVVALLAAFGFDQLRRGEGYGVARRAAAGLSVIGLALLVALAILGPRLAAWLDISSRSESLMHATLVREALQLTALSGGLLLLCHAASHGLVTARRASNLVACLLVVDLWHAALGLNRQVSPSFLDTKPGLESALAGAEGGRVFSFGVERSPVVRALLDAHPTGVEELSFGLSRRVLNPHTNVLDRVELAEGPDRAAFIPNAPLLAPWDHDPTAVDSILPRLRAEAVARVVSLDPIDHPDLSLRVQLPTGIRDTSVLVYDVAAPWPRAYVACRVRTVLDRAAALRGLTASMGGSGEVLLEAEDDGGHANAPPADCGVARVTSRRVTRPEREDYVVEADGPGYLVTRDSFTPSWRATVDSQPARVLRANGRHRAVPFPSGLHVVVLRYQPPGLIHGLITSGVGLVAVGLLALRRRT